MDSYTHTSITPRMELFNCIDIGFSGQNEKRHIKQIKTDWYLAENLYLSNGFGEATFADTLEENSNGKYLTTQKYQALHIEDDDSVRFLVKAFLKNHVEVDSAVNGQEALQLTAEKSYDLILVDINLGEGIDGIETTNIIRSTTHFRNTPVIAVTANIDSKVRSQCMEAGMDAFLLKPFLKNDLINTIGDVMKSRMQKLNGVE